MRRLMLLRHAKSDWPEGFADEERPLAERGRTEAPLIGAFMAREALRPDLVLVSPAERTRETWSLVSPALAHSPTHRIEPRLYLAQADALLTLVRRTPAAARTLLLIGHNPGLEELARALAGAGEKRALKRLVEKFPTSALAVIDFATDDWTEMAAGAGTLVHYVTPKSVGARKK